MTPEQIEHLKKLVAALAEWQLCMSYNDSYFGEPAGLVKRTSRELTKLLESVERTTSPVSQMTDERITEIKHEVSKRYNSAWHLSDSAACEFARAILAAAAPHAPHVTADQMREYARTAIAASQQAAEPVLWIESEPSARLLPLSEVIGGMCHTVLYHHNQPTRTSNPVWPLYAAPAIQQPQDERAAFEKVYQLTRLTRAGWDGVRYENEMVQFAWEGWQARAALAKGGAK